MHFILSVVVLLSFGLRAEERPESRDLVLHHLTCAEIVDAAAALHQVEPWFHPNNPEAAGVDLTFLKHKFARAFTFSRDGRFVAIHHDIYPDAEQITLRSLETGEKLSSLLWRGKGERLFDLRSLSFDGESRRLVGLAENFFTDKTDVVVTWDGRGSNLVEKVELQPPPDADFVPVSASGNNHSFRTAIEVEQPYYMRTLLKGTHFEKQFTAQIVDWQSKGTLTLSTASHNLIDVISQPFSARFRFAAALQNDSKTIQLYSFDEIRRRMSQPEPPSGLLGGLRARLGQLSGRVTSGLPALAAPARAPSRDLAAPEPFSAALPHEERVKKAVLSEWAPFLVTQTTDGLHIWNAKTGHLIDDVRDRIGEFRVLEKSGVLAYVDGKNVLHLYSMFERRVIASLPGFTYYYLSSHLDNRARGEIVITLDDGQTILVNETVAESGHATYAIKETGVQTPIPMNRSSRTLVATEKGRYLVQVSSPDKELLIEVYSLAGDGRALAQVKYPVFAFQHQVELDPLGQKVLYTETETRTGILHLARVLADLGL